jgi:PKD repeat protein
VAPDLWNDSPVTHDTDPCIYNTADLSHFLNNSAGYPTGLPAITVQNHYNIPGWVGSAPNLDTCPSLDMVETEMDFQAAATTAPGSNDSYTWTAASGDWASFIAMLNWMTSNDEAGVNLHMTSLSQSWGGDEASDCEIYSGAGGGPCLSTTYESDYTELAAMGVSVFASSADDDGTVGNDVGTHCTTAENPSLEEPGSFGMDTVVGGTALTATLTGTTAGDDKGAQVWNWGCNGGYWSGSQGGVSQLYPEQAYQYGYAVNSSMAFGITNYGTKGEKVYSATSARPAPDWSGLADNVNVYDQAAWQDAYGGTSDSSPATAGIVAELTAFDGHNFGLINPLLYSLANENLSGTLPGVPTLPAIEPTYQIQNWSNDASSQAGTGIANYYAAKNFNLSTGWGMPLAWNLANLAGKPWIATNPESQPSVGSNYYINATVKDYRALQYVNVTYKAPGAATWANTTLTLNSGNSNKGNYFGHIPGTALTTTGKLQYCVYAIDVMTGNSWSPWNQSGWVVNQHGSAHPWTLFGCNTPFSTTVAAGSGGTITVSSVAANRTATGETSYALCFNATFTTSLTGPFFLNWTWGDGTKTSSQVASASASPVESCHVYTAANTYHMSVFVNNTGNAKWATNTLTVTVYNHLTVTPVTMSGYGPWTPPVNRTFTATASNGLTAYTYSWTFSDLNTSTLAAPPYQIYYKPGTYTVTVTVTDSLGYHATSSYTFTVFGSASSITLQKGWNLIALPTVANSYTLYEMSVVAGPAFQNAKLLAGTTTTLYDRTTNAGNGNVGFVGGNGLWLNVSAVETITVYGNTTGAGTLSGVSYGAGWAGIGWTTTGTMSAYALAGELSGAEYISIWIAATQQWSTFIVGWDGSGSPYNFNIPTGTAVLVYTTGTGTITE